MKSTNSSLIRSLKIHRVLHAVVAGVCLFIAARLILGGPATPQISTESGGSDGYLTHVATDKPIYRTGEKVYVRGVVLRANGHVPGIEGPSGAAQFEIKGPKGDTVASGAASIVDSIVGFAWEIPGSQAGGEYTVRISHPYTGDAPAERKFDIRTYRAPRLKSQIVFVRDGYGPGDTVAANLHVDRAEGGIPARARVSVFARVDGEEVWRGETRVDGMGNASTTFKLPAVIARGEGSLAMIIEDGGTVETATKTIPILLQTLDLAIYPEGGDLIAGLPNRVYLEGKTPAKKPADMAGVVVNSAGKEVAEFRTEHEGRGRFSFIPAKGETYSLRVNEPAGIKKTFPLPVVRESGVVIASTEDVTAKQMDVVIRVAATTDGTYGIALTQRGKEFSFKSVALKATEPSEVAFTLPRVLDGVIVATVYNEHKVPMAERLLFRLPEHGLKVQVTADRADYVPGDKVKLRVATTDDTGKPVGAVVGLTVTDSSVLEMIDKREQTGRLPVMVLLENDVRNLSDAHVYLDETNPKAALATDLLLGTQGWRRFANVEPQKFIATNGDAARRVLGVHAKSASVITRTFADNSAVVTPGVLVAAWQSEGFNSVVIGTVVDSSGALIPGVDIRATADDAGVVTRVLTNEAGAFGLVNLVPGNYTLRASLPGFRTSTLTGVQLSPGMSYRYNFSLAVASVATMVEVSVAADRTLLSHSSASVGEVLTARQIRNLPLVGNNVLDLVQIGQRAGAVQINPDLVGEIRLILNPVDVERGRRNQQQAQQAISSILVIREYAHTLRPNWTEGSRADFAETVYWNAGVKTDASTGIANVSFNLSDSVTSFRVLADGFTRDGALGSSVSHVESLRPFFIEPKMPLQVTSGDRIELPIGIVNGGSTDLQETKITARAATGIRFNLPADNAPTLRAKERTRRLLQMEIARDFSGIADLTLDATAGRYRETVSRKLDVQPRGFPFEISSGGVLEADGSKSFEFTLPTEIVRGSLSSSIMVYPTPLASMTQALQSLIREPVGCFEQTSSISYPMVMAQQYFLTHTGVDAGLIEKTRGHLDTAYKRLRGFESRSRGYEWFGAEPGHEALTAYGLMQFVDMSHVRNVDKDMLDRTRAWLLSRRDGKGRFSLNARALDSFGGAPVDTTNAYILWALVESGEKGLEKEIASVKGSADSTHDSYVIALAANILHATGDEAGARLLMDKLAKVQEANGSVKGAATSITRSGGAGLAIETTALSTLAWMREPAYAANVEKSLKWIVESNKDGRFGSTQSTILALRAIVAYDAAHARPKAPGRIRLTVDGKTVGSPVAFTPDTQGAIVLPEFAGELNPGKHTLGLRMEDGSRMPFSMSVKYHSALPDSAEQTRVGIEVALKDQVVQEGNITEAIVSIANKSDELIPTPVAIVGIPGGLEVRHDQLKELVKSGKIDAYEVNGREVVLYWRFIKGKDKFDVPLSLVAAVPGSYTGPASRAYLYYTDEYKNWSPGLTVSIAPR